MVLPRAVIVLVVLTVEQVPVPVSTAPQAAISPTNRVDLAPSAPPARTNPTVVPPSAYLVLVGLYQVLALPLAAHVRLANSL